ncbi:hypothetical protein [Stenotrophomonas maltophilia]|uniref:hypothetical protein n=1 Tax=Stenotrophomonas maltophilia TaxID=40324 RepID=UPI002B1D5081|nr:hypothetical protein [Stenotrophomonas maltophilia]
MAGQARAWIGTPADGGESAVTLNPETRDDWQRYGRTIEPLFGPALMEPHGVQVMDRCIAELHSIVAVAADYDFDEISVQALRTAIESMEFRKASAGHSPVPDDLPRFLRWCADELMKRDKRAGSFAPSVAASLQGRACILEAVDSRRAVKS